jgi:hypothetical protein
LLLSSRLASFGQPPGRSSRQSAYVRLLLVCAGESSIVTIVRPVRRVFVLASVAGFVRSFVRRLGR